MIRKPKGCAALAAALAIASMIAGAPTAQAQSVEDFYRARSVTMIVPTAPWMPASATLPSHRYS